MRNNYKLCNIFNYLSVTRVNSVVTRFTGRRKKERMKKCYDKIKLPTYTYLFLNETLPFIRVSVLSHMFVHA